MAKPRRRRRQRARRTWTIYSREEAPRRPSGASHRRAISPMGANGVGTGASAGRSLAMQRCVGRAPGLQLGAQRGEATAGGDEAEDDALRQGSDHAVALPGQFRGCVGFAGGEGGEYRKAPGFECLPLGGWEAEFGHAAGKHHDDRLLAAEQDIQALALQRRMEAADDATTGIAPGGGLVEGFENGTAGSLFRAQERGQARGKVQRSANDLKSVCIARSKPLDQPLDGIRVTQIRNFLLK